MLPSPTLPASLAALLMVFQPCFTAPSFRTFYALASGFIAQTGRRTVCGMLVGAGLSRLWPHDRAHYFFAKARWSPDRLGLTLARLVVELLIPGDAPVLVAIDDTLFKRRGKKVWAASWFHDGSATGAHPVAYGNNWVILGIIVSLPFIGRPVCLPVLARLVVKNTTSSSRLYLARTMIEALAGVLPGRIIHGVGDAAYSGKDLRGLGDRITWTTRLRKDAALYDLAPARTGQRGRPKVKGDRLPALKILAARAVFTQITVTRYGKTATVHAAVITCLWYSVFGPRTVQVILIRDKTISGGYDLALVTTDLAASAAQIIERYAARWSVEVAFEDAKQIFGVADARNRKADAVRRTVPFALACQTLTTLWYATAGHDDADITDRRQQQPWYTSKTQPSTADMIAKLRRVLIAAKYRPSHPDQPTPAEMHTLRLAWEDTAA
jgi:hypothetical protein